MNTHDMDELWKQASLVGHTLFQAQTQLDFLIGQIDALHEQYDAQRVADAEDTVQAIKEEHLGNNGDPCLGCADCGGYDADHDCHSGEEDGCDCDALRTNHA